MLIYFYELDYQLYKFIIILKHINQVKIVSMFMQVFQFFKFNIKFI